MIKTAEELKQQAIKENIQFYPVRNCSICGYPCWYRFYDNYNRVTYDSWCDCCRWWEQQRSWEDLANTYNINQPENNPKISKKFLDDLNKVWKF